MTTVRPWRRDDGRVSIFVAVFLFVMIAIVGLVVDGSGKNRALEKADNIAAEAARAGGQGIVLPDAVSGGPKILDPQRAATFAEAYLRSAGVTGGCGDPPPSACVTTSADLTQLTVDVTWMYQTQVLDYFGINDATVHGHASAQLLVG